VTVKNERRIWIVVMVLMAMVGGQGLHWFFTPAQHPEAGTGQFVAVALQVVVGLGLAYYAWRRYSANRG
jgi:drug/metabolite transporter (DMT)-like permease